MLFANPTKVSKKSEPQVQTKLTVGAADDAYEQEADRVADQVMRMPQADLPIQRKCDQCEEEELQMKPLAEAVTPIQRMEEEEETLQMKGFGNLPTADSDLEQRLQSSKGGGSPLPSPTQQKMERGIGANFSEVRMHTGSQAIQMNRQLQARAFTHGSDIYFNDGEYQPQSQTGQHLLAHELTHVVQQGASSPLDQRIQRVPLNTENIETLRKYLKDDEEDNAIAQMGKLTDDEKDAILQSVEFEKLAISAFGNDEMFRAMKALKRNLYKSLEWMFKEGTNWTSVAAMIRLVPAGKDRVRSDNWMKKQFVKVCDNDTMAEAVDLLGGTLTQKFHWMAEEGSNWEAIKSKIENTANANEKVALYSDAKIRKFFVKECDNDTMAEAVDLLGGTLFQKLLWMKAEGSNWGAIKAKINATADPNEKTGLYANAGMKAFFVKECDNDTMAEAVDLLGGTLLQKLQWMQAEGTNWKAMKAKIKATADPNEKTALYGNAGMKAFFVRECNDKEMTKAVKLLGGTLSQKLRWLLAEAASAKYYYEIIREAPAADLTTVSNALRLQIKDDLSKAAYKRVSDMLDKGVLKWGEESGEVDEELFTQQSDGTYDLETYADDFGYDIEYRRTELRIIARIKLTGEATTPALRTSWITGITNAWNGKFHVRGPRRLKIIFDPIFTNSNAHHTVKVHTTYPRENSGNWALGSSGATVAHEFGHLVGHEDEYYRTAADFQQLVGRAPTPAEQDVSGGYTEGTSIMGNHVVGTVKTRHFVRYLNWLNANRNPGEAAYRLVAGP